MYKLLLSEWAFGYGRTEETSGVSNTTTVLEFPSFLEAENAYEILNKNSSLGSFSTVGGRQVIRLYKV